MAGKKGEWFAALKDSFEGIRDRWFPGKSKRPSAPRASAPRSRSVKVLSRSREELYARAKRLDLPGRSKMSKKQLEREIAKHK